MQKNNITVTFSVLDCMQNKGHHSHLQNKGHHSHLQRPWLQVKQMTPQSLHSVLTSMTPMQLYIFKLMSNKYQMWRLPWPAFYGQLPTAHWLITDMVFVVVLSIFISFLIFLSASPVTSLYTYLCISMGPNLSVCFTLFRPGNHSGSAPCLELCKLGCSDTSLV